MTREIEIAGRKIGPGHAPYVIAEISANHQGRLERALDLIAQAKAIGADAVKIQTYTADTITINHDGPGFTLSGGLWDGRRLYDLYQEAHTPWDWHGPLFEKAREVGIAIFSSPFDGTAVELLESLGAPAYKVASFELVDLPLIERMARTGKPLIMSTGMANLGEIDEAVKAARLAGAREIALLHCTSGYPTPPEESRLHVIPHLAETFDCVVGLSDHTPGHVAPVAAVALGASIIEKHFIGRRADGGPDAAFSLEPEEFRALVDGVAIARRALGRIDYEPTPSEARNRHLRRSLYVVRDVRAGETLGPDAVRSIRPGYGLAPKHLPQILGRTAKRDIARGTPFDWSMIA